MAAPIAEELAKKQQAISVAEFFEKNGRFLVLTLLRVVL